MNHPFKLLANKEIFREKVLEASRILHEYVAATLGPDGLPIFIKQYEGKPPKITKDGVTVADSIFVSDPLVDTIIQAIKEAARRTNTQAGDGTTTAIILTHAIIKEALKFIQTDIISPQKLWNAIFKLLPDIDKILRGYAIPVKTREQQHNVASISSNGDQTVATTVVNALEMAGEFGIIRTEEGTQSDMEVVHQEGFRLNAGFQKIGPVGPTFITHQDKQTIELNQPAIVIYDGDLINGREVADFINVLTEKGSNMIPIVIVAYSFNEDVIRTFLLGRSLGMNIMPLKCPIYESGDVRRLFLDDLATYVGGKTIDVNQKSLAYLIKDLKIDKSYLGSCKKIVMDRFTTVCYGGLGSSEEIMARVGIMQEIKKASPSQYQREAVEFRLAMMTGGVVTIKVGGNSELEMKERKDRVEDALNATKAAIAEGIVPGGGSISLLLANDLSRIEARDRETAYALKVLNAALAAPLIQLVTNVGESPDIILDKIRAALEYNQTAGWDASKRRSVDNMFEAGIIDPLRVTRSAVFNAISIAMELLRGGGAVVFKEKEAQEKLDLEGFYYNEKEQ